MEHMRRAAYESVLRACGFGSLAIFCLMFGMWFDPHLSFKAGGLLTTVMALILVYKSREALSKDYRKTEMWMCLPKPHRPPESYAQRATSIVLCETYCTMAYWASLVAIVLLVIALVLSIASA